MKGIYRFAFLALIAQMAFAQSPVGNEFTAMRKALGENAISTFVVLRLADNISTRVDVRPQVLREAHPPTQKYKIEMNDSRATLLMDWINQAKFTPRKRSPDCRWGLLFIDRNGKEVGSIFSDSFGRAGNVDGYNLDFPADTHLLDIIHALVGPDVK